MSIQQPANELPSGTFFCQKHADPVNPAAWKQVTREGLLTRLASEQPPEFRTILALTRMPENLDDATGWAYNGPFYADIDTDSIEHSIAAFHALLGKLQRHGLDLRQVRLYATGKKGFHLEVPQACLMGRIPEDGIEDLPKIYRDLAQEIFVDGLDTRVYSARRGRMWRVPNQKRRSPNPANTYKVPLTLREAASLTPAIYAELCSAPRPHPELAPPTLCTGLGMLYVKCRDRLTTTKRKRAAAGKATASKILANGIPDTVAALMQGAIRSDAGWNAVCIQMAALAHAAGWTEDELVQRCQGLIKYHRGDSRRYATLGAREREMRSVFRACGYEVSENAVKALFPRDLRAAVSFGSAA